MKVVEFIAADVAFLVFLIKKYLIFSEYDNSFNYKITNILDKWGLKYKSIQGTSATITKNIEKYKLKMKLLKMR